MKKIFAMMFILTAVFVYLWTNRDSNTSEVLGYGAKQTVIDDDCGERCGVPSKKGSGALPSLKSEDKVIRKLGEGELNVTMFYSALCPHCDDAREFFSEITDAPNKNSRFYDAVKLYQAKAKPDIKLNVRQYEILNNAYNRELFEFYCSEYGVQPKGLPVIFVGDETVESFPKASGAESVASAILKAQGVTGVEGNVYHVPIIGTVNAETVFLPVFTIFLGFIDGLNPCAMWVLVFLLGILAYSRSKRRMLTVGITFVVASGVVYFAMMAAWLNLFLIVGFNRIVMIILACIAIVMGLINLKELFFFNKGVSLMIPESAKPSIYKKARTLMREKNLILTIGLTFMFALFVNMIELACTAGFPAIFTKILADRNEPVFFKYMYMVLYNIMYVQPLLIIVVIFSATMGHFKMQEKHAKILKLISGALMLVLGIIMLVKPELMLG